MKLFSISIIYLTFMNRREVLGEVIYIKTGGIKNVINSTQYQRALMLSRHFDLIIVTDGDIPGALEKRAEASFKVRTGWGFVASTVRLLQRLSKEGHRVVYSSNQPRAVIASYLAKRLFSFRWVVDLWDDPMLAFRNMRKGPLFTSLYRKFLEHSLPRADAWVLGLHEEMLQELPPRGAGLRVLKISNGTVVSLRKGAEERRLESGGARASGWIRVGHAGWVTLQRGMNLVLALLQTLEEDARFCFRAWGPAEDDALEAIQKHNGQSRHKLNYLGKISHENSLSQIAESDVCLCLLDTSVVNFRYSYPIKLFEYMAAGKVVIATNTPAIREVIEDGKSGFLIENTVDSLKEALERVASMKEQGTIRAMEEAAKERVKAFDWEDINDQVAQFLSSELSLQRKEGENG